MWPDDINEASDVAVIDKKADAAFKPAPELTANGKAEIRPALATEPGPDMAPAEEAADTVAENGRMLARIALLLLVLILLVNVPITNWGASLLQIMPQEVTPVAIAEGMVLVDEQGNRYLLHNHRLRLFDSPEAYERYTRLRGWRVQPVADRIIGQYGHGLPIYHLAQCEAEATVYVLEQGEKRPFTPPANTPFPFTDAGWDQIELLDCHRLAGIPEGPPKQDD